MSGQIDRLSEVQVQDWSMPPSPIWILKKPLSPQSSPHEFAQIQYSVPFSLP